MNFGSGGWGSPKKPAPARVLTENEKRKIRLIAVTALVLIVFGILLYNSIFTVIEGRQAVVTTFGRYSSTVGPGIHFKLPFIQRAQHVDVTARLSVEIGGRAQANGQTIWVESESKMITGDFNILNVDLLIEYRISNARDFLFNSRNPEEILRNLAQSQIRNVIGSRPMTTTLTAQRVQIQAEIGELISGVLDSYNIGLTLYSVRIRGAEPPTYEVFEAFRAVQAAEEGARTEWNEALAYENTHIPQARAEEGRLIASAEYWRQNRINDARRLAYMFNAMYSEYSLDPIITRQRMYYEMLEEVLPGIRVFINTETGGNTNMMLPLDNFNR